MTCFHISLAVVTSSIPKTVSLKVSTMSLPTLATSPIAAPTRVNFFMFLVRASPNLSVLFITFSLALTPNFSNSFNSAFSLSSSLFVSAIFSGVLAFSHASVYFFISSRNFSIVPLSSSRAFLTTLWRSVYKRIVLSRAFLSHSAISLADKARS